MEGRIIRDEETGYSNLPIIGKIKVGALIERNGKTYPTSLDYFRADGKYAQKFIDAYPGKPNKIQIIFASDDITSVCDEKYELRGADGRLWGTGDGYTFRIWDKDEYKIYTKDKDASFIKSVSRQCGSKKGWESSLTLRFIIPKISGVMGVWQFTTKGSASSIPSIIKAYDTVLHFAGTVQMIPFDLQVDMVTSQKPGSKSKFPVISLVPNIDTDNLDTVRTYLRDGGNILGVRKLLSGDVQKSLPEITIEDNWEEVIDEDLPFK